MLGVGGGMFGWEEQDGVRHKSGSRFRTDPFLCHRIDSAASGTSFLGPDRVNTDEIRSFSGSEWQKALILRRTVEKVTYRFIWILGRRGCA
jgi:hypothetical protein